MNERLSTTEVAEAVGVPVNTVKNWLHQIEVPAEKDGAGRWRFRPDTVEVLKIVKALREEDRSFETIRRRIDRDQPEPTESANNRPGDPGRNQSESGEDERAGGRTWSEKTDNQDGETAHDRPAVQVGDEQQLARLVAEAVAGVIKQENDLAQKFAHAAHEVGRLEERCRSLETKLTEREAVLTEARQEAAENASLRAQIAEAQQKIATLEAEKRRPWWRPW